MNANFTEIQVEQKQVIDAINAIEKAYHAGMVTQFGKIIIYGIGGERGTWGQFANIHIQNLNFSKTKESLSWLTNIYNKALRNQGKSDRKTNFWLSQQQEIEPVIRLFGLQDTFNSVWNEIRFHDIKHNLASEAKENGRVANWETRTMTREIILADYDITIMDSVVENILKDELIKAMLQTTYNDSTWILQNAFISGTQGLTLGQKDLEIIEQVA